MRLSVRGLVYLALVIAGVGASLHIATRWSEETPTAPAASASTQSTGAEVPTSRPRPIPTQRTGAITETHGSEDALARPPRQARAGIDLDAYIAMLQQQPPRPVLAEDHGPGFRSRSEARQALRVALGDLDTGAQGIARMEEEFFLLGGAIGPDGAYSYAEGDSPEDTLGRLAVLRDTLAAEARMQENREERLRRVEEGIRRSTLR